MSLSGPPQDVFTGGEVLPDQAGADAVLMFNFSSSVELVWVRGVGALCRADPFGGTPALGLGIPCADDEPTPITVRTSQVRVYAPSGATRVSVWGFRL